MKTLPFALLVCLALPLSATAADQDLMNEEWVIDSKGVHGASFTMPAAAVIHLAVTPVKNCGKGFTVRLVPSEDYSACVGDSQGRCRSRPGFDGFKVASLNHAEPVPPGRWTVYVQNSENVLERATVHVHLTIAR